MEELETPITWDEVVAESATTETDCKEEADCEENGCNEETVA